MTAPFRPEERDALRSTLLEAARADPRITGGAITGSVSTGAEDPWSDVDLAFGVRAASEVGSVLEDFSARMYRDHLVLHHVDVPSGAWIYRVFLLPSTLQVDLAFAPAAEFGARGPAFRLVFGADVQKPHVPPPQAETLIGLGWLYALHARSSIWRLKPWQAEYMISALRDQVLALACLRHGFPAREGRGIDQLPPQVTGPLGEALVRSLDPGDVLRAFRAATRGLLHEIHGVSPELEKRLEPALLEMTRVPSASQ
ncbi:MAG TPA: nucleotidyltransferase domain-containing protein [Candidatus Eisenbacteria bacterium]